MPDSKTLLVRTLLSVAAIALLATTTMAEETQLAGKGKPVTAKLLILPGDNIPVGMSDVNSPTRELNLASTFEGSSSHTSQNYNIDVTGTTAMSRKALGVTKTRKASKPRRKVSKARKQRVKVAGISISQRTVKRRAQLMHGVYR